MIQRIGLAVVAVRSTKLAIPFPARHEGFTFYMGKGWGDLLARVPIHSGDEERSVLCSVVVATVRDHVVGVGPGDAGVVVAGLRGTPGFEFGSCQGGSGGGRGE